MTIAKTTTHAAEAKDNLAGQFKGQEKLEALLTAFINEVQDLENVLFDVLELTSLDEAFGEQLDGFGSIVGENREGRTDDDFRLAIRARLRLNLSNGTAEDMIELIRALVGDKQVEIVEDFAFSPAHFDAYILDPIDVDGFQVAKFVRSGKPAGVRAILHWFAAGAFQFDVGPGFDVGKLGGGID